MRRGRQTTHTIAWFNDIYRRELLNLNPPYQRRSVWNQAFKDRFIDTVFQGYPTAAIFLYESITEAGAASYQVVDGKQRLTCVFDFIDGLFPIGDHATDEALRGRALSELSPEVKTEFWTYQFSVEYLPTNDSTILNDMFDRLNRNTVKLTDQELRHARFDGAFMTTAESLTGWMLGSGGTPGRLPRGFPRIVGTSRSQMKDVEVVSHLLAFLERGTVSISQLEMDAHYADRDTVWELQASVEEEFRSAIQWLAELAVVGEELALTSTRLQNQSDFYSLFAAAVELRRARLLPPATRECAKRLAEFARLANDDAARAANSKLAEYWMAARAAPTDSVPRATRIRILRSVIVDEWVPPEAR